MINLILGIFWLWITWLPALAQAEQPPAVVTKTAENPNPAEDAATVPVEVTPSKARELFMSGAYDEALAAYEQLETEPDKALAAQIGLARVRLQVGDYENGLEELLKLKDKGLEGQRNEEKLHVELNELIARYYLRLGHYEKTLEHARVAIDAAKKGGVGSASSAAGARRLLAETLEYLGRRDDAIEAYRWFDQQIAGGGDLPRDPEHLTHLAVGFVRYSVLTQTNVAQRTEHALQQMLQVAYERLDRGYWPARVAAGDLLRERYNNSEEDGSISDYEAALKINSKIPEAHVGLGEVALEGWQFEIVEHHAAKALAINPRFAPALHLTARKFLLERRYDQAREAAEQALILNPQDLVAIAFSAAASACQYNDEKVTELNARAAAINPNCAPFHRTLGDALGGIRQYAASEREYLKAIELDPTDANARTELGMMYMQWGLEDKAQSALDAAWELDRYNQRTKFTLDLLDKLTHFAKHETENFEVRHDDNRDPGLGEYASDYLEPIYDAVTGDYQWPLDVKTMIEFFPTHRTFAVRITGKPWIHTVGACTGRVIALSTPRDSIEVMGRYNMARVLLHEFTHTVTLAATDNRIPHWFTEGLAVYQENAPRGFDWMELLAVAARRGQLFTLESIDWGFIRPKRATDRPMAYAQSEWMVEYIIERFGYAAIRPMLDTYRIGKTQEDVFREQFKLSLTEFDADFAAWAKKHAGEWGFDMAAPENTLELRTLVETEGVTAAVFGRLARAEFDDEELDRAAIAARQAVERDPREPIGLDVLVKCLSIQADNAPDDLLTAIDEEALPLAKRLAEVSPNGWTAPKALAEMALRREDWAAAKTELHRLQKLCPADPFSSRALAAIYLQEDNDKEALAQLMNLAPVEQADPDIPAKIAEIAHRRGDLQEAMYWFRQALAIDPFSADLHEELAGVAQQAGDHKAALREYRMLSRIEPTKAKHFERAAVAADRLGDTEAAKSHAAKAVKLDPNSPAKALLLEP